MPLKPGATVSIILFMHAEILSAITFIHTATAISHFYRYSWYKYCHAAGHVRGCANWYIFNYSPTGIRYIVGFYRQDGIEFYHSLHAGRRLLTFDNGCFII